MHFDKVFLTIPARAIDKNITFVAIVDAPESAEKSLTLRNLRQKNPRDVDQAGYY
ncbi:MAG: hypothetical protein Q7T40_01655 [Methylobacter sp.]|nr:hypothetical protein [Methylobacter sp.]